MGKLPSLSYKQIIEGKSTQTGGNLPVQTNTLQEFATLEKMIRIYDKKIPKFNGNRKDFIPFFTKLIKTIDKLNFEDNTKIRFTKHFLVDSASAIVESFNYNDWSLFKKKLLETYILDKKLMEIDLKKEINEMKLKPGETITTLYNQIHEKTLLLMFLNEDEFPDVDIAIRDKLLASIPSRYYYRLKDVNVDLPALLVELDKIQALDNVLNEELKSRDDPAVNNVVSSYDLSNIRELRANSENNGYRNYRDNYQRNGYNPNFKTRNKYLQDNRDRAEV